MTLFTLYLLAILDGLLCGLRTSMGRCPLIGKRQYYARALLHGFAAAQVVSVLALGALCTVHAISGRRELLRNDLEFAAGRMLWVFLPYALLVLLNLALRLLPSIDIRSATSVFMLGPLTAIRPAVMIIGVLYGISKSSLLETRLLGLFILTLMLALEFILNGFADHRQSRELRELVRRQPMT